jgi:hypothetical protein
MSRKPSYQGTDPNYGGAPEAPDWDSLEQGENPISISASGRLTLTQGAITTARPASAQGLLEWHSEHGATPVALIVDIASLLGATAANPYQDEQLLFSQLSGLQLGTTPQPAGALRVRFGLGSTIRTLEADLRGGSFQLPPCEFVNVAAFIFGLGPINVQVSAAVVPGVVSSAARFTSTFKPTLAPLGSVTEEIPFGARWVALSGGAPTGIGAGQPNFTLSQAGGGIYLSHNFVDGIFISQPGQPVELVSRGAVTLLNNGAAAAAAHVKFFLEP